MLCEKCNQNEATVYYSETYNGNKKNMHLCGKCAEELGISGFSGAPSMLSSLIGEMFSTGRQPARNDSSCSVCGMKLRELAKSGKVGCSECYVTFRDVLAPTIRRIHGGAVYKGTKTADNAGSASKSDDTAVKSDEKVTDAVGEMKKQLAEAIKREDYESAAVLRDKIRATADNN